MAQLHINRAFAENLGLTLGGSVREQVTSLFNRDVAKAAGVRLNPLPFVGSEEKARFRVMWAAALQGASLWAVIGNIHEFSEDEKLLRKMIYQMQQIVDDAIFVKLMWAAALQGASLWAVIGNIHEFSEDEKLLRKMIYQMQQIVDDAIFVKLFSKLTQEDQDRYHTLRRRLYNLGRRTLTTKEDFAREFLAEVRGFAPADVPDSPITDMAYHFDMARLLSVKLIDITVNSPSSYHRTPNAKAQN